MFTSLSLIFFRTIRSCQGLPIGMRLSAGNVLPDAAFSFESWKDEPRKSRAIRVTRSIGENSALGVTRVCNGYTTLIAFAVR